MTSDPYHRQANQIIRQLRERTNRGTVLNKEADKLRRAGRYKAAQSIAEQSIRSARGSLELDMLDDSYAQGVALIHLAAIFHAQEHLDEAANKYQESTRFFLSDKHSQAVALFGLATVCEAQGKWLKASQACSRSLELLQDMDRRLRRTVESRYRKILRDQQVAMDSGDTGGGPLRRGRAGPVQTEPSGQEAKQKQEEGEESMPEQTTERLAMNSEDIDEESLPPGDASPQGMRPSEQEKDGAAEQSPPSLAIQLETLLTYARDAINLILSSPVLAFVSALAGFVVIVLLMLLASILLSVRSSLHIVVLTAAGTALPLLLVLLVLVGYRAFTFTVPPDRIAVIGDSREIRVLEEGQSILQLPLYSQIQAVIPTMELRCRCPKQKVALADGVLQLAPVVYYQVNKEKAVHAPHFFRESGENNHKKTKKKKLTEADMKTIWDKEIVQEMAVLLNEALCGYRQQDVHDPPNKATACQQLMEGLERRSDQWGITINRILLPPLP